MTHSSNYKKYTVILLLLTAAALTVWGFSAGLKQKAAAAQNVPAVTMGQTYAYYSPKPIASQENTGAETISRQTPLPGRATPAPAAADTYLVTVHEGRIGVFQNGEKEPFLTADIPVYLLPAEDIALLRKGLPAQTLAQVRSILEDYE